MPNNQTSLFVYLAILAVITLFAVAYLAWTFRKESIVWMTDRLEQKVGLAVPDELLPLVGRGRARRRRLESAVRFVALLSAASLVPFVAPTGTGIDISGVLLILGAAVVGSAVGSAIGSLQWPVQRDQNAIRFARAGAVGLGDYLPRFERRGAWAAVALAVFLVLVSVTVNAAGVGSVPLLPPATGSSILTVAAIVALGFFEIVSRRIVGRAQPTGSELELVWDDALRSMDVRDLASAPTALGLYGAFVSGTDLMASLQGSSGDNFDVTNGLFASVLALIFVVVSGVVWLVTRPDRFFLRRLWPQYVDVGALPPLDVTDTEVTTP